MTVDIRARDAGMKVEKKAIEEAKRKGKHGRR